MMRQVHSWCSKYCGVAMTGARLLGIAALTLGATSLNAQMAPIQLTNPAIDAVNNDKTAAWIADENLGVLYCELIRQEGAKSKRVACFDSNGAVAPAGSAGLRAR